MMKIIGLPNKSSVCDKSGCKDYVVCDDTAKLNISRCGFPSCFEFVRDAVICPIHYTSDGEKKIKVCLFAASKNMHPNTKKKNVARI